MSASSEPTYSREEVGMKFELWPAPAGAPDQSVEYTNYHPDHGRVQRACVDVLCRMPREAADIILRRTVWWEGGRGRSLTDKVRPRGQCAVVLKDEELHRYPCDVRRGIIALKFAHVVLPCSGRVVNQEEIDRLACEWGFETEVAAANAALQSE